ncbi:MAG TPA: hypothetical protein VMM36_15865 [Opitutaceae bacterium]|nr:hypothetical protein [Opitutaceae bacterium]
MENLYRHFQDLDRRCLSDGLNQERCVEVAALKRRAIESSRFKNNPIAAEVLAGRTTFVAVYDSFSHEFRGLRRFVPKSHDPEWNERLDCLAQILPNVGHFRRRSYFAFDNPLGSVLYGIVAGFGIAVILAIEQTSGGEPGDAVNLLTGSHGTTLMALMACVGFVFGSIAMLRYRTRDYKMIHGREAAGYMDVNYAFFRESDDAAWARMLDAGTLTQTSVRTRPD